MSSADTKLLVSTAIEQTWGTDEPIVFLGEWCRRYERRHIWSARDHRMVPYHWDDRSKLRDEYYYLRDLRDAVLAELAQALNRYHQVDRPVRYWHMLIGPWLLSYVAVVWDRWECLRVAFESGESFETIGLEPDVPFPPHLGYSQYELDSINHLWNHGLFLDLIEEEFSNRCSIRRLPIESASITGAETVCVAKPKPPSFKNRFAQLLDRLVGKISAGNRVVFFTSYFPLASLVKLNLSLRQLPRLYLRDFEWPIPFDEMISVSQRSGERPRLRLRRTPTNAFEAFLGRRIAQDIPWVHVEGYSALRARAETIPMRPKAILTAGPHWGNEVFKVWSAEQVLRGTKLVTMEHGGSFHMAFDSMDFEENISEVKTVWRVSRHPKNKQLPPNKLAGQRKFKRVTREYLAVSGYEMPVYAYRAQASPVAGQTLVGYNMVCQLYAGLSENVRAHFRVKPYPERGWSTRQRFIDSLGADKVSNEPNYLRFLSRARLNVSTYPQTTFSEAMASEVPSLLVYAEHFWETVPELDPLLDTLRTARIVFHDSTEAAAHINRIWADPDRWWSSDEVLQARREFHRLALNLDDNWLASWTSFIESVIT